MVVLHSAGDVIMPAVAQPEKLECVRTIRGSEVRIALAIKPGFVTLGFTKCDGSGGECRA